MRGKETSAVNEQTTTRGKETSARGKEEIETRLRTQQGNTYKNFERNVTDHLSKRRSLNDRQYNDDNAYESFEHPQRFRQVKISIQRQVGTDAEDHSNFCRGSQCDDSAQI